MTDVISQAKYVGVSAQKVRLVVDMVRGQKAEEAVNVLKFMPKVAARHVLKVVQTAMANADENFGLNTSDLIIKKAFVDEAPTRKWRRFGARGRFKPVLRRSSHITIVVAEQEGASS
jgi:large subunit ribosomal protein L22